MVRSSRALFFPAATSDGYQIALADYNGDGWSDGYRDIKLLRLQRRIWFRSC